MATYVPAESKLVLRVQIGNDELGRPQLRSQTIRGIDASATADAINIVAGTLGDLLSVSVAEVNKVDTVSVE